MAADLKRGSTNTRPIQSRGLNFFSTTCVHARAHLKFCHQLLSTLRPLFAITSAAEQAQSVPLYERRVLPNGWDPSCLTQKAPRIGDADPNKPACLAFGCD